MLKKEKVEKVIYELLEASDRHREKSEGAVSRTMAGYHKGVEDALEIAAMVLKTAALAGDVKEKYVGELINSIARTGTIEGDEEGIATAYFQGQCEGRSDGADYAIRMIRTAREGTE